MSSILLPLFVQLGLTFSVLPVVGLKRLLEVTRDKSLARTTAANNSAFSENSRKVANNFDNQFQMPVLFYLGCIFAYFTTATAPFVIYAAWAFVSLRIVHTIIHTTYNYVPHRFLAYLLSTTALAVFLIAVFAHVIETQGAGLAG